MPITSTPSLALLGLLSLSFVGSALLAGLFYKIRTWSKRELWRILAFGSATLIASGLNLIIPAQGKAPLFGTLLGFAIFFALENFTIAHSCPENLDEGHVHGLGIFAASALVFHSLFDGMVLGISAKLGTGQLLSVCFSMAIHKFADAMTLLALFESEPYLASFPKRMGAVLAITLATPIGALLTNFLLPLSQYPHAIGILAGVSAGCLIYIGASNILPRIHRLKDPPCFAYFMAGLVFMVVFLGFFNYD